MQRTEPKNDKKSSFWECLILIYSTLIMVAIALSCDSKITTETGHQNMFGDLVRALEARHPRANTVMRRNAETEEMVQNMDWRGIFNDLQRQMGDGNAIRRDLMPDTVRDGFVLIINGNRRQPGAGLQRIHMVFERDTLLHLELDLIQSDLLSEGTASYRFHWGENFKITRYRKILFSSPSTYEMHCDLK